MQGSLIVVAGFAVSASHCVLLRATALWGLAAVGAVVVAAAIAVVVTGGAGGGCVLWCWWQVRVAGIGVSGGGVVVVGAAAGRAAVGEIGVGGLCPF